MFSSAFAGQGAVSQLPSLPLKDDRVTLDTFCPPPILCVNHGSSLAEDKKKAGAFSNSNFGIEILKVTTTGKLQPRRLAFANNNRTVLISTQKIQRVMDLFKTTSPETSRRIDISCIDRVQIGQQTKKFVLARTTGRSPVSKPQASSNSLSIVYRVTPGSNLTLYDGKANSAEAECVFETLDIVIPSFQDYIELTRSLEILMGAYRSYRADTHRDVLLLEHHWIRLGKTLDKPLLASEWADICLTGLNVPLKRANLIVMYKNFCRDSGMKGDEGLRLSQAVGLLKNLRYEIVTFQHVNTRDPAEDIWEEVVGDAGEDVEDQYDMSDVLSLYQVLSSGEEVIDDPVSSDGEATITAEQFLAFLKKTQHQTNSNLVQIHDLFQRLNSQTKSSVSSALQLAKNDSDTVDGNTEAQMNLVRDVTRVSKTRITKSTFLHYLSSDANDLFDPSMGAPGQMDMTHPLTSYWINTSHDTYLKDAMPGEEAEADVEMYAAVLRRGCRCIELDVWDGPGNEPVIRFKEIQGGKAGPRDTIPFQDVLRVVRAFLQTQPSTYPVILSIEDHCSVLVQDKMAMHLTDILGGKTGMLYMPSESIFGGSEEDDILPSPHALRGKVVVKSKRPKSGKEGSTIVRDDLDYDNDLKPKDRHNEHHVASLAFSASADTSMPLPFETVGSVISDTPHTEMERTPDELLREAETEADDAKMAAHQAEHQSFKLQVKANRAKEQARVLMHKMGFNPDEMEGRRQKLNHDASVSKGVQEAEEDINLERIRISLTKSECSTDEPLDPSQDLEKELKNSDQVTNSMMPNQGSVKDVSGSRSFMSEFQVHGSVEMGQTLTLSNNGKDAFGEGLEVELLVVSKSETNVPIPSPQAIQASVSPPQATDKLLQVVATSHIDTEKEQEELQEQEDVADGALEVQHFFAESVNNAKLRYAETEEAAILASKSADKATFNFRKISAALSIAEEVLYLATQKEHELENAADRAAAEARSNHEHADIAKQRTLTVRDLLAKCDDQAATSETVAVTAVTEAKISEQRAVDAEKRAMRAQGIAGKDRQKADEETRKEEELDKQVAILQQQFDEATQQALATKELTGKSSSALEKITTQIKMLEASQQFKREVDEAEQEKAENDGEMVLYRPLLGKHKAKQADRKMFLEKTKELSAEGCARELTRRSAEEKLYRARHKAQGQAKYASSARRQADQSTNVAEQLTEYAEEEREAAKMRNDACEKATECVKKSQVHHMSIVSQLAEAERAAAEAYQLAEESRAEAEQIAKDAAAATDKIKELKEVDENKIKKGKAALLVESATSVKSAADSKAAEAKRHLNTAYEVFYQAKRISKAEIHRIDAEKQLERNAIKAHERALALTELANNAREDAAAAVKLAADKVSAAKYAKDYMDKKSMVKPVSLSLARLTLIHSTQFRYWQKSIALPTSHMHSVSEGQMYLFAEEGPAVWEQWVEFNKNHLCRVYPSRHAEFRSSSLNYNPVLPWAMGCQMVSVNYQSCDDFLLLNDGRFRVNASSGYVLKPERLTDGRRGNGSNIYGNFNSPRKCSISVLGGYNLTRPENRKGRDGPISPRVRLAMFDGTPEDATSPQVHVTEVVKRNGLNPIWKEKNKASFLAMEPSVSMLLITVWDSGDDGVIRDDFIAAASLPVSCLREGYRSVPLFDANHTRMNAHSFSSLLVKVKFEH